MKKEILAVFLALIFMQGIVYAEKTVTLIPYPERITFSKGKVMIRNGYKVFADKTLEPLAQLLTEDLYTLFQLHGQLEQDGGKAFISLLIDQSLPDQAYKIRIRGDGITISGKDYNNTVMGVTTLLQLCEEGQNRKIQIPYVDISDSTTLEYRCMSLDVARQPIDIETVRQCVELCRWYKIRYMQLHLTDDQQFTFPSKAFPELITPQASYTEEELRNLVEFAQTRGVVIIPEFDVPGHTGSLRRNLPEVFGTGTVIDMTEEKTCKAVKTIMKEMMDIFYTSPYFHIGGDEAWLAPYGKKEKVREYIRRKGYDGVLDIYLDFIADLNRFVRENGKQTIVWEGFPDKGSKKITIPDNLLVIAWETIYQPPKSLLDNGYSIINASWKPCYVCPGANRRWSPESIYGWNVHRWEHFSPRAPSYTPIQLDKDIIIKGAQMCSWEMKDAFQIASLHQRIPAFSEVAWHGEAERSYSDFEERYVQTDRKFMRLIFPAELEQYGFKENEQLYQDEGRKDHSGKKDSQGYISVKKSTLLPGHYMTYTEDGSKPGPGSPKFNKLETKGDKQIKFGIFTESGKMAGYRNVFYKVSGN